VASLGECVERQYLTAAELNAAGFRTDRFQYLASRLAAKKTVLKALPQRHILSIVAPSRIPTKCHPDLSGSKVAPAGYSAQSKQTPRQSVIQIGVWLPNPYPVIQIGVCASIKTSENANCMTYILQLKSPAF